MDKGSADLEAYADTMLHRAAEKGFRPTVLIRLRETYGTVRAFSKLFRTDDIESGFRQMKQLGLIEWSIEAAVVKFSREFDQVDVDLARRRLKLAPAIRVEG
jgi:hypothetical protein